jgi:hypothetical protein
METSKRPLKTAKYLLFDIVAVSRRSFDQDLSRISKFGDAKSDVVTVSGVD